MSRFVRPEKVRLELADVARRERQALLTRKKPKATQTEIDAAAARVAEAEELNDWIEVKKRLNTGEQRARFRRAYLQDHLDGQWKVNQLEANIALVTAYLLDWSLTDESGHKVEIAGLSSDDLAAVLDNLDPDSFGVIRQSIALHESTQISEAEEAKKKIRIGAAASEAISPLPSGAGGASGGSVN